MPSYESLDSYIFTTDTPPTSSTPGEIGKFCKVVDSVNNKVTFYKCTAISGGSYTWEQSALNLTY